MINIKIEKSEFSPSIPNVKGFYTAKLILIILAGMFLVWLFKPNLFSSKEEVKANFEISADSIKVICEMAGASQKITVKQEIPFTKTEAALSVVGYDFFEKEVEKVYAEKRTWVIKCGTAKVEVDGFNILLSAPEILSCTEDEEAFEVLQSDGAKWSPAHVHKFVAQSRRLAERKAVRDGIYIKAKNSIYSKLKSITNHKYRITWQ